MDVPASAPAPRRGRRRKVVDSKRLTIEWFRERGAFAEDVEKWVPHTFITRDFAGIGDVIAVDGDRTYLVQSCVGRGDVARHLAKIRAAPDFPRLARAWTILLMSWRRVASKLGPPHVVPRMIVVEPKAGGSIPRDGGI